jgi:hypothetical protein
LRRREGAKRVMRAGHERECQHATARRFKPPAPIHPPQGVGIGHVYGVYKSWTAPYELVAVALRSDGGQTLVIIKGV